MNGECIIIADDVFSDISEEETTFGDIGNNDYIFGEDQEIKDVGLDNYEIPIKFSG